MKIHNPFDSPDRIVTFGQFLERYVVHLVIVTTAMLLWYVAKKAWRRAMRSPRTLPLRLRFQDYSGTFCKMALVDELKKTICYIVEYKGLRFGDRLVVRIANRRPLLGSPFHLSIDWNLPKRIYWLAEIHPPRYDDVDDGEEEMSESTDDE